MGKDESDPEDLPASNSFWRKIGNGLRIPALLFSLILLLCFVLIKQSPPFYLRTAEQAAAERSELAQQFELCATRLQNDCWTEPTWTSVIQEPELNAWLADQLARTFPDLMLADFSRLQVHMESDQICIGATWNGDWFSTVLSIRGNLFFTDQSGEIAIQLKGAAVGRLPIPIGLAAQQLSASLESVRLPVEWVEHEGKPTALIQIGDRVLNSDQRAIRLESINLAPRRLEIVGSTQFLETEH